MTGCWKRRPSWTSNFHTTYQSDREYFDFKAEEEEDQELFEESPDEYYTQSYPGPEEAGEAWAGEEEAEEKHEETQEEYDAKRKKLLAKARADIALKAAKSKDLEKGLKTPIDKSHEWKFYTENGSIWKQNYKTGEKIWWNYDYMYKHKKGKRKGGVREDRQMARKTRNTACSQGKEWTRWKRKSER